ncbi:hypothetical protein PTTG_04837 [Puccinia triticina 1-1 BBBD Race 1]|uniref:Uncharacterized protein n=1 Tax=Puccinia triticina (isolate 1-1 / race 1 (BBBD)) TaxID=630390 RepID=A0A180FZI5_PUCT1|nr:hypothetical protein PTTG_04837 [Puccinia triticina 1-1 BBBD Race 1]
MPQPSTLRRRDPAHEQLRALTGRLHQGLPQAQLSSNTNKPDGTPANKDNPANMANWNVKLKELYPAVASPLRHVFTSAVIESNQFHILMCSDSKLMAGEDNTQKTELVRALLNLWTQDSKLAFFVPFGRGPPVQHTGRSLHELNSRLASAAEINPDDLEMFVYLTTLLLNNLTTLLLNNLTTLLLNNQNPRPIRQAAMTRPHPPSRRPLLHLELPLGLRQTRAIVGSAFLKALLDSWLYREEGIEVLQLLKAFLDRLQDAVEWSERGYSPGFPFASKSSPGDWHIFGNFLRLAVPLGLCTVDQ